MNNNPISSKAAIFFSYLFHPLFLTTYGLLVVLYFHSVIALFLPPKIKVLLILITIVFTTLLPILNLIFLKKMNMVKTLEAENKEDRRILYFITLVFYLSEYYLLSQVREFVLLKQMILGCSVAIFLVWIINFFWKISAHMVAIGGLTGLLFFWYSFFDFEIIVYSAILCAGIIAFARLKLGVHSPAQVYSGFFLGLLTMLFVLSIPIG